MSVYNQILAKTIMEANDSELIDLFYGSGPRHRLFNNFREKLQRQWNYPFPYVQVHSSQKTDESDNEGRKK